MFDTSTECYDHMHVQHGGAYEEDAQPEDPAALDDGLFDDVLPDEILQTQLLEPFIEIVVTRGWE